MKKKKVLRVCINLPGTIDDGYYSPERGESRWAQNLLYVLGDRGHDVVGCSIQRPMWGKSERLESVHFCDLNEAKEESIKSPFDILFDPSWFHPGMTNFYRDFRAEVFIHGHWGGCCLEEPGRFPGDNHYIAYPNLQVATSMVSCAFRHLRRHLFLPIPLIFRVEHLQEKEEKVITWCVKEAFYKRKGSQLQERAWKLWRVCEELYKNKEINVFRVLNGDQLKADKENDDRYIERLKDTFLFEKAVFYADRTPYDIVQRMLFESQVLVRTGEPPGAPMEYEAIAMGCFPLIWEGQNHPFQKYYDCFGLLLKDDMSVEDMRERIRVLLFNDYVRSQLRYLCLSELTVHFDFHFIEEQLYNLLSSNY